MRFGLGLLLLSAGVLACEASESELSPGGFDKALFVGSTWTYTRIYEGLQPAIELAPLELEAEWELAEGYIGAREPASDGPNLAAWPIDHVGEPVVTQNCDEAATLTECPRWYARPRFSSPFTPNLIDLAAADPRLLSSHVTLVEVPEVRVEPERVEIVEPRRILLIEGGSAVGHEARVIHRFIR